MGLRPRYTRAIEVQLLEHLDVAALSKFGLEREVRMFPIAVHAQALEAVALHVDELLGPLAAQTAHRRLRQLAAIFSVPSVTSTVMLDRAGRGSPNPGMYGVK